MSWWCMTSLLVKKWKWHYTVFCKPSGFTKTLFTLTHITSSKNQKWLHDVAALSHPPHFPPIPLPPPPTSWKVSRHSRTLGIPQSTSGNKLSARIYFYWLAPDSNNPASYWTLPFGFLGYLRTHYYNSRQYALTKKLIQWYYCFSRGYSYYISSFGFHCMYVMTPIL